MKKKICLLTFEENPHYGELKKNLSRNFNVFELDIFQRLGDQIKSIESEMPSLVITTGEYVPAHVNIISHCKEMKIKTLHLLDGITEWRNNFERDFNYTTSTKYPPPHPFLYPSICDFVGCISQQQLELLSLQGNAFKSYIVGSPRLDSYYEKLKKRDLKQPTSQKILIATSRTPLFSSRDKHVLLDFFHKLSNYVDEKSLDVIWRVSEQIASELGVQNSDRNLSTDLEQSTAVFSMPSTLLIESMLSKLKTGILNPFSTPLFISSPWVINSEKDFGLLHETATNEMQKMKYQEYILSRNILIGFSSENITNLALHIINSSTEKYTPKQDLRRYREFMCNTPQSKIFSNYDKELQTHTKNIDATLLKNLRAKIVELENQIKSHNKDN